jgi:hypothetical protein
VRGHSSIDGSVGGWSIPTSFLWDQYFIGPLAMTTGSVLAPDGNTVVSGNFDGTAVLWSLDGDWSTPVGSLGSAASAAVDPVGRRVAVVDQTGAAIEIVPTDGTPALRLPATPRAVRLALDGEGHLAVGHVDGTVTVRDGASGAHSSLMGGLRLWDVATRTSRGAAREQLDRYSEPRVQPDRRPPRSKAASTARSCCGTRPSRRPSWLSSPGRRPPSSACRSARTAAWPQAPPTTVAWWSGMWPAA